MATTTTLAPSTKREGVYDHDHLFLYHPKPNRELLSRRLCVAVLPLLSSLGMEGADGNDHHLFLLPEKGSGLWP